MKSFRPSVARPARLGDPRPRKAIATNTMGRSTTSFSPLSSCSGLRASSGMSRRRSKPRSKTGSVEASAAPRIAAAGTENPSSHHAANAMMRRSNYCPRTKKPKCQGGVTPDVGDVKRDRVGKQD